MYKKSPCRELELRARMLARSHSSRGSQAGSCLRERFASSRSSQAALEFLTTYVWAFFIIAITIGALYYFGIFDFSKYLPQRCIFPSQLKCLDFSLQPSEVKVKLVNNLGEDIKVTSLQITNDAAPPISCIPPASFDWAYATEKDLAFTGCTGGAYLLGERVELRITINYYALNTPSKPTHIINGKINGRVSS